jgi:hypothetical protein
VDQYDAMEFIVEQIQFGRLTLVLSILEKEGCRVFITAKDEENRRVWKTPVLNESGLISIYPDQENAITDAKRKVSCLQSISPL